jgi:lysozyme
MTKDLSERPQGIDVSHHQGVIDWNKVAQSGVSFAYIKLTDGQNFTDPRFTRNWIEAKAEGLLRGAYHFFHPLSDADVQAEHFVRRLATDPGELPPMLDIEVSDGASAAQLLSAARRWMDHVEKELKCKPFVYTTASFWKRVALNSSILSEFPLWVAHYTDRDRPAIPSPWPQWTIWQYSQSGNIPGIDGPVDLNLFGGTTENLYSLSVRQSEKAQVAVSA